MNMNLAEAEDEVMILVATAIEKDDGTGTGVGDSWLEHELARTAILQTSETALVSLSDPPRMSALGRRIKERLIREICSLLCSDDPDDVADRKLLGIDEATFVGAVLIALTGAFGVSTNIALVIAALLFRRLVEPTRQELCRYWKTTLSDNHDG